MRGTPDAMRACKPPIKCCNFVPSAAATTTTVTATGRLHFIFWFSFLSSILCSLGVLASKLPNKCCNFVRNLASLPWNTMVPITVSSNSARDVTYWDSVRQWTRISLPLPTWTLTKQDHSFFLNFGATPHIQQKIILTTRLI